MATDSPDVVIAKRLHSLAALGENRTEDPAVEQHLAEFHAAYAKLDTDPTTAAQLDAMVAEIDLELHDTQEVAAPLPGAGAGISPVHPWSSIKPICWQNCRNWGPVWTS